MTLLVTRSKAGLISMNSYWAKREFTLLCVSSFFVMAGTGIVGPILPQYVLTFGVSYSVAGLTISAYAITRLLTSFPAGILADRFGRKTIILGGMTIITLATLFCGLSQSIYQLIFFRMVQGAGSAFFALSAMVIVTDLAPIGERAKYLGYYQGTFHFGAIIGPAIGGILADVIDIRAPFFALSVFAFASVVLSLLLLKESSSARRVTRPPEISSFSHILLDKSFLVILLVQMMSMIITSGIRSTMVPIFGVNYIGLSMTDIGFILSIGAFSSLATLFLIGNHVDKFGRRPIITLGLISVGLGVIYFVLATDFLGILVGILIMSLAQAILGPSKVASVADYSGKDERGTTYGVFRTAGDLGILIGPLLSTSLLDRIGVVWPFFATSSMCFVTAAITFFFLRENKRMYPSMDLESDSLLISENNSENC